MTTLAQHRRHHIRWAETKLPVWQVEKITRQGFRGWIKVTCPRCKNYFVLRRVTCRRSSQFMTRPCPFCFATNRLPKGNE